MLIFIRNDTTPNYIALSSDIADSTIEGISIIGGTVLTTDDGEWYIIEKDLTLTPYSLPISFNGTISIGEVAQGQASLTEKWLTKSDYFEDMEKMSLSTGKGAVVQTSTTHWKIHMGELWQNVYYQNSINQSTTIYIGIVTGAKEVHLTPTYSVSAEASIETFRLPSFSGGTENASFNHNFSAVGSPLTKFYIAPVITNNGTTIRKLYIPGGAANKNAGIMADFENEFILAPNAKYLIKYTNLDGNSAIYNPIFNFYEED